MAGMDTIDRAPGANAEGSALRGPIDPFRYVVKVNATAAVTGLIFFALAVGFAWAMFEPYVPAAIMQPWLWATVLFLLVWLVLDIVFLVRRPGDRELVMVWTRAQMFIRIGSNAVVIATIWLFLPHAPRDLQLVLTIFYVAHVPTQTLTMPENAIVNGIGATIVLGSAAATNLIYGGAYSIFVAIFLMAYAVAMVAMAFVVGRLINNSFGQRRSSDEAAIRLEQAVDTIAAERDAKTRFIATASHDLGQPLQAAGLFFDQTMRARDDISRARAADGVRKAFAAADQLLSHMLNHLRLEADAVEPHASQVALTPLFERLAAQYGPASQAAGMVIGVAGGDHAALLDPVLIERAMGNLLSNAVQHSGATRVLVAARWHDADWLRLWVIDNGVGVGRIDAARIFDDYYRGSDSRQAVRSGFGLGLSSVRRIALLMGGSAGLDPRWLKGSAFYLEMPGVRANMPRLRQARP
jgi:signal transduction histidine kinase